VLIPQNTLSPLYLTHKVLPFKFKKGDISHAIFSIGSIAVQFYIERKRTVKLI